MGAAQSLLSTFLMMACCSSRSSSFPMASLIAKGTGRGLKNLGVESGLTWRVAFSGYIVPNSSLKRDSCFVSRVSSPRNLLQCDANLDVCI